MLKNSFLKNLTKEISDAKVVRFYVYTIFRFFIYFDLFHALEVKGEEVWGGGRRAVCSCFRLILFVISFFQILCGYSQSIYIP